MMGAGTYAIFTERSRARIRVQLPGAVDAARRGGWPLAARG